MSSGHRDHLPRGRENVNKTFGHGAQPASRREMEQTARGQGKRAKANAKNAKRGDRT
jgi:hypothetical protein